MSEKFDRLCGIMTRLRGANGCPWDKEQSRDSIKQYVIEEAYELLEALESNDPEHITEELGDLLHQIIFHTELGREAGEFDMDAVLDGSIEKMIRRHPHVFGDVSLDNSADVLKKWEEIKQGEKKERNSVLDGVPKNLPSLLHCYQVQKRAARVGFDWQDIGQVMKKLHEEVGEFEEALDAGDRHSIEEELGDMMFVMVNISRFLHLDPELVMKKSANKFVNRFHRLEELASSRHGGFTDMTLEDMERLWNEVKAGENGASFRVK